MDEKNKPKDDIKASLLSSTTGNRGTFKNLSHMPNSGNGSVRNKEGFANEGRTVGLSADSGKSDDK